MRRMEIGVGTVVETVELGYVKGLVYELGLVLEARSAAMSHMALDGLSILISKGGSRKP